MKTVFCGWEIVIIIIISIYDILNVAVLCQINLKAAAVKCGIGFCGSVAKLLLKILQYLVNSCIFKSCINDFFVLGNLIYFCNT